MREHKVGFVSNYFGNISVAAINVTSGIIQVGDTIHFKGNTTDCEEKIESMQIDRVPVKGAKAGESIGIKTSQKVRRKDEVYKILPD